MSLYTLLVVDGKTALSPDHLARLPAGWVVHRAADIEAACALLRKLRPDAAVCGAAEEGVARLIAADPGLPVLVAGGEPAMAARLLGAGAWQWVAAPSFMPILLERAAAQRAASRALGFYRQRELSGTGCEALLGDSAPMQATMAIIRRLIDTEQRDGRALPAVLIGGETGTGRQCVARALHVDGPRHGGPFVPVNCATVDPAALEEVLFGSEGRGGLVESAIDGTLFLDEIGACGAAVQARLIELITARTIRLRFVCATSRNLEQLVREGRFSAELNRLLRGATIAVAPLRERGDDIAILAQHFLAQFARRYGKPELRFNAQALAILRSYAWPGNVRELRNMLDQTVMLARGKLVTPNQLAICPGLSGSCDRDFQTLDSYCMSVPSSGVSVPDVEHDLVVKILEKTDWNVTKSARLLGLTRDQLRYRIEKLGLERPER